MGSAKELISLVIDDMIAEPEKYKVIAQCNGCRRKSINILDHEDFEAFLIIHAHGNPKWVIVTMYQEFTSKYRDKPWWSYVHKISLEPES